MNPLSNILDKSRFTEPPEVNLIKKYVRDRYYSDVQVTVQKNQITIITRSGALAGSLRMEISTIQEICQTEKKLILRISH